MNGEESKEEKEVNRWINERKDNKQDRWNITKDKIDKIDEIFK